MIKLVAPFAGVMFMCLMAQAEVHQELLPSSQDKADRIVVYSASWCPPCQRLKPVLRSLKQEGYDVVYRDVEKDGDQLKYEYTKLPTIYFLSSESVIKKETGYRDKEHIKKSLLPPAIRNRLVVNTN